MVDLAKLLKDQTGTYTRDRHVIVSLREFTTVWDLVQISLGDDDRKWQEKKGGVGVDKQDRSKNETPTKIERKKEKKEKKKERNKGRNKEIKKEKEIRGKERKGTER